MHSSAFVLSTFIRILERVEFTSMAMHFTSCCGWRIPDAFAQNAFFKNLITFL